MRQLRMVLPREPAVSAEERSSEICKEGRYTMKHNGMHVLNFRVPALVERELCYLRGTQFLGRLVALCFLPYAGLIAADEIDHQAYQFNEIDATFVVVGSGTCPLHRLWLDDSERSGTAVLADPCSQLHRAFGVAVSARSPRCHTFVIDRDGILWLRVSHDFVDGDLDILRKIVGSDQLYSSGRAEGEQRATGFNAACLQS